MMVWTLVAGLIVQTGTVLTFNQRADVSTKTNRTVLESLSKSVFGQLAEGIPEQKTGQMNNGGYRCAPGFGFYTVLEYLRHSPKFN